MGNGPSRRHRGRRSKKTRRTTTPPPSAWPMPGTSTWTRTPTGPMKAPPGCSRGDDDTWQVQWAPVRALLNPLPTATGWSAPHPRGSARGHPGPQRPAAGARPPGTADRDRQDRTPGGAAGRLRRRPGRTCWAWTRQHTRPRSSASGPEAFVEAIVQRAGSGRPRRLRKHRRHPRRRRPARYPGAGPHPDLCPCPARHCRERPPRN